MKKILLPLVFLISASIAGEAPPNVTHSTSGCTMSWDGVAGSSYFLLGSADLINWSYFSDMKYGTGSYSYGFTCNTDKFFVRLACVDAPWITTLQEAKDADFDSDGIPNIFELEDVGSDPLDKESAGGDSDSDGLNDGWELYYFGDLNTADPTVIESGDGLNNKEKNDLGLDPNKNYTAPTTTEKSSYSYDLTGRLTIVTAPVTGVVFTMDSEGNILTAQ